MKELFKLFYIGFLFEIFKYKNYDFYINYKTYLYFILLKIIF
jgi:hypothetical protein